MLRFLSQEEPFLIHEKFTTPVSRRMINVDRIESKWSTIVQSARPFLTVHEQNCREAQGEWHCGQPPPWDRSFLLFVQTSPCSQERLYLAGALFVASSGLLPASFPVGRRAAHNVGSSCGAGPFSFVVRLVLESAKNNAHSSLRIKCSETPDSSSKQPSEVALGSVAVFDSLSKSSSSFTGLPSSSSGPFVLP